MNKKEKDTPNKKDPKKETPIDEKAKTKDADSSVEEKAEKTKEEQLQEELDKVNDQLLRVSAEYANFRTRSIKEKESSFSNAKSTVVKEFLSVADNLARAVDDSTSDFDGLKKGLKMTSDELQNVLNKLGVEVYGESGDTFDPNLHNAVMHIEDENLGDNEITDVFQKGYKINETIIRPAMVKVAN